MYLGGRSLPNAPPPNPRRQIPRLVTCDTCWEVIPPLHHRCKNITWPQTSFAGDNNIPEILMVERGNKLNWTWMCPSLSTRITPYIVEPAATYHESHPAYVVMFISVLLTAKCGRIAVGFTVDILCIDSW